MSTYFAIPAEKQCAGATVFHWLAADALKLNRGLSVA
jgi:hypothetical protein